MIRRLLVDFSKTGQQNGDQKYHTWAGLPAVVSVITVGILHGYVSSFEGFVRDVVGN